LRTICGLFGYTRQAYYKQQKTGVKHQLEEEILLDMIKDYRKQMPRIGGTKLHYLINQSGYSVSRKALYDVLRENKLLVRRRKKYAVTTNSRHWMHKWPNLIRGFDFHRANLLWVSDITYINLNNGFAYLSLVTDAYSHKIIGYKLSPTLGSEGTITALCMAIENTPESHRVGLIHHSDRGVQYCCKEYVKILRGNNIRISMTENGDPYENDLAERVNGILKSDWLDHEQYDDFEQANIRIGQIVNTYNTVRPHSSCDMLTPELAQYNVGKLKKRWKNRIITQKKVSLHKLL
jgi:transposase InsO family protein